MDVELNEQLTNEEFEPISPVAAEALISHSPKPNDPPWTALPAVAVWIASILLILVVPSVFLLPYLALQGPPVTDGLIMMEFARTDAIAIILQIIAIIPAHLLTLLVAWVVITRGRRFSFFKMLGWEKGGFAWWHYIVLLIGFFVLAAIVGNYFPEKENDLIRILQSSRSAVYIVAIVATLTAPLVEEVIYRGVLYSAFQRAFGIPAAFLLVTALFALVHVPQYYPSYSTIFLLTVLSLTLTAIRVKSNNLLPCVILHTLFNGIQSVFLILQPDATMPTIPEQATAFIYLLK
ncbi:CPBP family intramembrane metalloprotease [soil metagenome]